MTETDGDKLDMHLKTRRDFGKLLAQRKRLGPAAEIGVAEGRYSATILGWGVERLYLVDLWRHVAGGLAGLHLSDAVHEARYQECRQQVAVFGDRAVFLRGWSEEMARHVSDGSLDFVHLDATHDYQSVANDLRVWYPKLAIGGIMSGHDYLTPCYGVRQAADEFAKAHNAIIHTVGAHSPKDACFWFEASV